MSKTNLVNNQFVTGGAGKIEINRRIADLVQEHFGDTKRDGLCVSLVGFGEDNFKRHIREHTVDFSCDINKLIYVDNMPNAILGLKKHKDKLYSQSNIKIIEGDILNVVEDLVSRGKQISVLDHDGVLHFGRDEDKVLELGASSGCEIMIITVSARGKPWNQFLKNGWNRYNGRSKECNFYSHQGHTGEEWRPKACVKHASIAHRHAAPIRNIQAFMMKEKADLLGYRFIALPYKGGTGGNGKATGNPMMVGLFLKINL